MKKQAIRPIADDQTIVRKVSKTRWVRDLKTGLPSPLPQAFELRDGELYLSASWLENSGTTRNDCILNTVNTLRTCTTIKKGDKCAFALGNVGAIKDDCRQFGKVIRIVHERKRHNPSYAAVRQIGPNNLELMERLASRSWSEMILNSEVPEI